MKFQFLAFFVLSHIISSAQFIPIDSIPYHRFNEQHNSSKKLIMITDPDCTQCQDVAQLAFDNPILKERLKGYNLFTATKRSIAGITTLRTLKLNLGLGLVAVNDEGDYLLHLRGTTSMPHAYLDFLDKVDKMDEPPAFVHYLKNQHLLDSISIDSFETIILALEKHQIQKSRILDRYAKRLPIASLFDADQLQFLFERAPIVGSNAFDILKYNKWTNKWLYRKNQSNGVAKMVNNKIIAKSRRSAIRNERVSLMEKTARFAEETWGQQKSRGKSSYLYNMLEYYYQTKDTTQFENLALQYYQHHYKEMNFDSLRQRISPTTVNIAPRNSPAQGMNAFAWKSYQMSNNNELLANALRVSQESLKFHKQPEYMDTCAHLLYKMGRRQEAIEMEENAIERLKLMGVRKVTNNFYEALDKMKTGKL